ncbi:ATP-binding protein [Nonomuraea gerenzanensis]|nr:ATP-binding protein [Nonomuraea gerenzanensis]UBU12296.1 ATP-binding protein [Nonomuraea gerenzanensis]
MRQPLARSFNTTGPCDPRRHYMLPPAPRLPDARVLIEMDRYFVLHAPRQTGKTTTLNALASELTAEGDIAAVMFSCERAKSAGDDYAAAESLLLESLRRAAEGAGWPPELLPPDPWPQGTPGGRFISALTEWCLRCPRRVVLFMDEIDALQGNSLVSILSQLREGHNARHGSQSFPASVVLCGLRDVRDYKVASGGAADRHNAASPFNIIAESLRLSDFTTDQIAELYDQHTQATGQKFTKDAVDRVFELTQGQPWLVNAVAHEITFKMGVTGHIATEQVEEAKERLIRARATHLDALTARLYEPRVTRVIEPILAGTMPSTDDSIDDDASYVHDLGLISDTRRLEIANPIYREVLLRVLGARAERFVMAEPHSFVLPDGRFDLPRLLEEFVVFWREHGEVLIRQEGYHEAACQIILMAFLHRLVNGGGYLDREYAAGTKRLDVFVRWPYPGPGGERLMQREAMELKVWRAGENDPMPDGLARLDRYLDRLTLTTGVLVIFDRRPEAPPWRERGGFEQATTPSGRQVTVLRI